MGTHMAQGQWTQEEANRSINWLELRAIRLVLLSFQQYIADQHVLVLTDNITAKAHVNRQGGTRSRDLMLEASVLGTWAESNLLSIVAEHISGEANVRADWLSRAKVDQAEW